MVARLSELSHIDMSRVATSFAQARVDGPYGVYAALTPLRFAGGKLHQVRRGHQWALQRVCDRSGREMLYLLSFCLPRFIDLPWREKLRTIAHELWHIGPRFDGDLRRFDGRCYAHSRSKDQFDALAEQLVKRYLAADPPEAIHGFLRHNFRDLVARHGRVFGTKIRAPKLIRVE